MISRGFSLVEVLIVLVLTSVLMIMMFSALRTGASSLSLAGRFVEKTEEERQLINLLHRHMRQVVPSVTSAANRSENSFRGYAKSIRYVAPLSMSAASQPYLIEINAELIADSGIWIRFVPFGPGEEVFRQLEEQEYFQLSEHLQLEFSYFDNLDGEASWLAEWRERTDLPKLLGLRLSGASQRSPELVLSVIAASPFSRDPELRRALEILEGFKPAQ